LVLLEYQKPPLLETSLTSIIKFGENGLGMIVSNIATLRPLFRKVFRLGESDSASKPKKSSGSSHPGYGFPNNSRRTYNDVERGYEMDLTSGSEKYHHGKVSTQVRGGSVSSDSESQKQILDDTRTPPPAGIVVSRQVNVQRQ
jgi:hypothetical protein